MRGLSSVARKVSLIRIAADLSGHLSISNNSLLSFLLRIPPRSSVTNPARLVPLSVTIDTSIVDYILFLLYLQIRKLLLLLIVENDCGERQLIVELGDAGIQRFAYGGVDFALA